MQILQNLKHEQQIRKRERKKKKKKMKRKKTKKKTSKSCFMMHLISRDVNWYLASIRPPRSCYRTYFK